MARISLFFHAYDSLDMAASEPSATRRRTYAGARAEKQRFEPLAQRARDCGVPCTIAVRPGLPADEIVSFLHGRKIDLVIMGAHTPGPIGKMLVGSVAEAVLRTANVPVNIVGPEVVEGTFHNCAKRTILCSCSVSPQGLNHVVVRFAAELAANHNAGLILHYVIPPQERTEIFASRSIVSVRLTHGVLSVECLRPGGGGKFCDALQQCVGKPRQGIGEVIAHRDFKATAAFYHREDSGYAWSSLFASDVDPVATADGNRPH